MSKMEWGDMMMDYESTSDGTEEEPAGEDQRMGEQVGQKGMDSDIMDFSIEEEGEDQMDSVGRRAEEMVGREPDYDRAKEMIRKADPWWFITSYPNIISYLSNEKKKMAEARPKPPYITKPWQIPPELQRWKEENIDSEEKRGRGGVLVLVGPPRSGKTEWGLSFGRPIEMSMRWSMKNVRTGATHIVSSDFDAEAAVVLMGLLKSFRSGTDEYLETEQLDWRGLPCIWTCNEDLNPMQVPEVKDYIEKSEGSVDYYLKDGKKLY